MPIRQAKLCKTPDCGKLTFSGLCLDCRRKERANRLKDRRGTVGVCRHCRERIFEPFSDHADKCEAYRTWSGPAQNTKEAHS
jgi:NMD protein affecting ribosome stability and mRNA decay